MKLNHSVSFPFSLDISSFLSGEKGTEKVFIFDLTLPPFFFNLTLRFLSFYYLDV